jgi:hypothetical protein
MRSSGGRERLAGRAVPSPFFFFLHLILSTYQRTMAIPRGACPFLFTLFMHYISGTLAIPFLLYTSTAFSAQSSRAQPGWPPFRIAPIPVSEQQPHHIRSTRFVHTTT